MRTRSRQAGFTVVEVLLALIFIVILVFTGYFIWHNQHDSSKPAASTTKSTSTTTKKEATTDKTSQLQDETANWLLYQAPNKLYTIRLADGWKLNHCNDSSFLYTRNDSDLQPVLGTKAVVTDIQCGSDGTAVGLYVTYYNTDETISPYSNQLASLKTNDDLTVNVSNQTATEEPQGIGGLPQGATGYQYVIQSGKGSKIVVDYGFDSGDGDHHTTVEQVIKTVHFN